MGSPAFLYPMRVSWGFQGTIYGNVGITVGSAKQSPYFYKATVFPP